MTIAQENDKTPPKSSCIDDILTVSKSANLKRLQENFAIFDFTIDAVDMNRIDTFNENLRPDGLLVASILFLKCP